MASLKKWTVKHLRDLARKHLGKGHSRLKTRDELLAALRKVVPGLEPEEPEPKARGVEVITFEKRVVTVAPIGSEEKASAAGPQRTVEGKPTGPAPTPAVTRAEAPKPASAPVPAPKPADTRAEPSKPPSAPVLAPTPERPSEAPHAAEPLIEGFFVARVQGESEARAHHLTVDQAPAFRESRSEPVDWEQLPELPHAYGTDTIVLCARDPRTAWTWWDIRPETRDAALADLAEPKVVLRVLREGHEVLRFDVALESRGFYVYGLDAGQHYRVELHAVGRDGTSRRIARASNTVQLPADAVSGDHSVRMMRVPWGLPVMRLREGVHRGEVKIETPPAPPAAVVVHEHWVPGPNSGSWQLERWQEQLEIAPQPLPTLPPPPLPGGTLGGSSSWTLGGSSGWLGSGSGLGRSGESV